MNIKNWRGCGGPRKVQYLVIIFSLFFFLQEGIASETKMEELLVTFKLQQTPVKDVIQSIALQTGYTVKLDKHLETLLVSGEFHSVEVSSFFKKVLKNENLFIIISPKVRIISVLTAGNKKTSELTTSGSVKEMKKVGPTGLENPVIEYETDGTSSGQESEGGIYELDNNFPIVISGNNKHIIDSQTGKPWQEAEELLK